MASPKIGGVDLLTLQAVLEYCKNWFFNPVEIYHGGYTVENGRLSGVSDLLQTGQYYRIVGSVFNDGLHQYAGEQGGESDTSREDSGGGETAGEDPSGDETGDGTGETASDEGGMMDDLIDEVFDGAIWALSIPPAVIALAGEIADWKSKYQEAANSPYTSESFAGYSYTKASGATQDGGTGGWAAVFAGKLARWRKLF